MPRQLNKKKFWHIMWNWIACSQEDVRVTIGSINMIVHSCKKPEPKPWLFCQTKLKLVLSCTIALQRQTYTLAPVCCCSSSSATEGRPRDNAPVQARQNEARAWVIALAVATSSFSVNFSKEKSIFLLPWVITAFDLHLRGWIFFFHRTHGLGM